MKLEKNDKHNKISLGKFIYNKRKVLAGGLLVLNLCSGCVCDVYANSNEYFSSVSFENAIELSNNLKLQLEGYVDYKNEYSIEDFNSINELSLMVESGDDLSFLNYCNNLKKLVITYGDNVDSKEVFNNINCINNLEYLSIICLENDNILVTFNKNGSNS